MYKLEYKEKISAEAEKLCTDLQKVGSAAYSETKEEPPADTASGDTPSAYEPKEENKEDDKKES